MHKLQLEQLADNLQRSTVVVITDVPYDVSYCDIESLRLDSQDDCLLCTEADTGEEIALTFSELCDYLKQDVLSIYTLVKIQ